MHIELVVILFHPGDLSFWELAGLLGMFIAIIVLPIVIVGFIIYKVIHAHSSDSADSKSSESITLGISESKRTKLQ